MSDKPRTCRATKDDGTPCQSPFVQDNGFCAAHDPEADPGEMRRRGRRGGEVTRERMQRHQGLDPDELPKLVTHADARAWLEIVGRAASTGRLETNAANACIRAIREWISAHQGEVLDEKLDELQERLDAFEAHGSGKRAPDPNARITFWRWSAGSWHTCEGYKRRSAALGPLNTR